MTYYKIRNRLTGLYSKGGTRPTWSTRGKTWQTQAALGAHLAQMHGRHLTESASWEVVTFELREVSTEPVRERMAAIQARRTARKEACKRQSEELSRKRDLEELTRLQKKLGLK